MFTCSRTMMGLSVLLAASAAWAGSYSPGKGGAAESAFIDAGIAAYTGPAGEGVVANATNGNYVNPVFVGWATGYVNYVPSDPVGTYGQNGLGTAYANPSKALGAPDIGTVSLGDMNATEIAAYKAGTAGATQPGTITLTFANAITNGAGADFAVFENGFVSGYSTGAGSVAGQMFAELAYVEVSTDGIHFARFASDYENSAPTGSQAYLTQDVSGIYNLAGKHANGGAGSWGTPFDLDTLLDDELVLEGLVDLSNINFVRIVDIPGDGSFTDASGNPIYDAWVTWGSGGFDLDAVGVINAVPEPATALMLAGFGALTLLRRKKIAFSA